MFNLLRMDLYRVKRSRSVYVCFGIILGMILLSFFLWYLMITPQGRMTAERLGMEMNQTRAEADQMIQGIDFLSFIRQIALAGGSYNLVFGIWVMLFVCLDFHSGFIKNVMSLHQNRWSYVGGKILTAAIVNACYLILYVLACFLMNMALGGMVPMGRWQDLVFCLSWNWLVATSFSALIILVCVLTRSVAAGAVITVLFSSGMLVVALNSLLTPLHLADWLQYSIYFTMAAGPEKYTAPGDLYVYAVGGGMLAVYGILAGIVLRKRDI